MASAAVGPMEQRMSGLLRHPGRQPPSGYRRNTKRAGKDDPTPGASGGSGDASLTARKRRAIERRARRSSARCAGRAPARRAGSRTRRARRSARSVHRAIGRCPACVERLRHGRAIPGELRVAALERRDGSARGRRPAVGAGPEPAGAGLGGGGLGRCRPRRRRSTVGSRRGFAAWPSAARAGGVASVGPSSGRHHLGLGLPAAAR